MFREAPLPFAGQRPSDRFLPLQCKLGQPCIQICFGRFEAQLLMDSLIDGDGKYTITLYRNISGTTYKKVTSQKVTVKMEDELAP